LAAQDRRVEHDAFKSQFGHHLKGATDRKGSEAVANRRDSQFRLSYLKLLVPFRNLQSHAVGLLLANDAEQGIAVVEWKVQDAGFLQFDVDILLPRLLSSSFREQKSTSSGRMDCRRRRSRAGDLIVGVTPIYRRILAELERDPNALYNLDARQMEELVAVAYDEEGWKVILTPRSGDGGKDVIATRPDYGTIRILDQVKKLAPHNVVTADVVRALFGVVAKDPSASKGFITTTSSFAPGIAKEFRKELRGRLSLRDGNDLRKWLLGDYPQRMP